MGFKKLELLAVVLALLVLVGTPSAILAYQYGIRPMTNPNTIDLVLQIQEDGGFSPNVINVKKGQLVRIHATSHDVAHGLFLGDLGIQGGVIEPGKWSTIEFVVDEAGEYSFTCNIRCSPEHAKMRGKIVVED